MREKKLSIRDRIQSEQIRTLFSQTSVAVFVHLFSGAMIAALLWGTASRELLLVWLSILTLASVLRTILARYYLRLDPPANEWRRWAAVGVAIITVFGLTWGTASILFLSMNNLVSVVVVVSVNAGSASTMASYPLSFHIFATTTFLPMLWVLIASGTTTGIVLAILAALTSIMALPLICHNINKVLERSLRLGFENETLRLESGARHRQTPGRPAGPPHRTILDTRTGFLFLD